MTSIRTIARRFTYWLCLLATIGFLLGTVVYVPVSQWLNGNVEDATVTVVAEDRAVLTAPFSGVASFACPCKLYDYVTEGQLLGTIHSPQLLELIREKERQLSALDDQLLGLELLHRQSDQVIVDAESRKEILGLEKNRQDWMTTRKTLQQRFSNRFLVAPASGWLLNDLSIKNLQVVEGQIVVNIAPVGSTLKLKVDADVSKLNRLSTKAGFGVKLMTSRGWSELNATRCDGLATYYGVGDKEGSNVLRASFLAKPVGDFSLLKPGDCGLVRLKQYGKPNQSMGDGVAAFESRPTSGRTVIDDFPDKEQNQRVRGLVVASRQLMFRAPRSGHLSMVSVKSGDDVCAGQVLARIDSEAIHSKLIAHQLKLQQADSRIDSLEAYEELIEKRLDRMKRLVQTRSTSLYDFESLQFDLAKTKSELCGLLTERKVFAEGLAQLRNEIGMYELAAPFSGKVVNVVHDEKDFMSRGDVILTLQSLDTEVMTFLPDGMDLTDLEFCIADHGTALVPVDSWWSESGRRVVVLKGTSASCGMKVDLEISQKADRP